MLRRRLFPIVPLILIACATPSKPLEEVVPTTVSGWTRTQAVPLDAAAAPALITQLGLKKALSATYTGPAAITVRVYEMNVPTSAFELIQKWPRQDGLAVYNGPYFVVAAPDAPPQASLLLEGLRQRLQ